MAKEQVFISYKSEEIDEALWVKDNLEAHGLTCWMAPMSITGSSSFATEIPQAISDCPVFVLLLSRKAQQSKIIPKELDQAISEGKIVMPFMMENCPLEGEFKFYLRNVQYYYAYQDKTAAMNKMLREIHSKLEPPKPRATKQKQINPASSKSGKRHPQLHHIFLSVYGALANLVMTLFFHITQKVVLADTIFEKKSLKIFLKRKVITYDDMQKLFQFKRLRQIELVDCVFKTDDLSAFGCQPLQTLILNNCQLTDKQLRSIPFDSMELSILILSNNKKLTDLSVIAPLADTLTELSIRNANIKDLGVLSTFTRLSHLYLSNNSLLTDLSPIVPLAGTLTVLAISNTGVNSLDLLYPFTKITRLYINNLHLRTLAPLSQMVYLDSLFASGNLLTDLTGLENTTILKKASLRNNRLENVDQLAHSAETLREIHLDNNALTNLSCLSACTEIVSFSANNNLLDSILWAWNWNKLTHLSVANNQIQLHATHPPGGHLKFLDLSQNDLCWFSDFKFASYGVTINLSDNRLTSVSLPEDSYYKQIFLHGNPLETLDIMKDLSIGSLSVDYFDGLNAKTVTDVGCHSHFYIINCPPKHIVELERASGRVKLLKHSEIAEQLPAPEFPEY